MSGKKEEQVVYTLFLFERCPIFCVCGLLLNRNISLKDLQMPCHVLPRHETNLRKHLKHCAYRQPKNLTHCFAQLFQCGIMAPARAIASALCSFTIFVPPYPSGTSTSFSSIEIWFSAFNSCFRLSSERFT